MDEYLIEILIIATIFLTLYSYLFYPLILFVASLFRRNIKKQAIVALITNTRPGTIAYTRTYTGDKKVTLIISAQNSEKVIRSKIENSLQLKKSYKDLEIIVASDKSTDATDRIVLSYGNQGIKLVALEHRGGKEAAQQEAIKQARGDIIVFTDATTILAKDAITKFLRYFHNENIGAVSSEDRYVDLQGIHAEEGTYIRYEMWLRKMESLNSGLIGLSGSLFAIRRELCAHWDIATCSDFNCALNAVRFGYKSITAKDILGYYPSLKNRDMDFERRIRTIHRGMKGLWRNRQMLNIFRYGFFAFQLLSHKLMRWITPFFGIALLVFCLIGYPESSLAKTLLMMQIVLFFLLTIGNQLRFFSRRKLFTIFYFLFLANLATIVAFWRFIRGKDVTIWAPSDRVILDSFLLGESDLK